MADEKFNFDDFTIGLIGGLVIGALAGVLLAPAEGTKTRKFLSEWAIDTSGSATDLIDQAKKAIDLASNKAENYLGLQEKGIKRKLDEIRAELERYDLSGS